MKTCSCSSDFQDEKYGKNMRVHSACKLENSKYVKARCSVCGREKDNSPVKAKNEDKEPKKSKKK